MNAQMLTAAAAVAGAFCGESNALQVMLNVAREIVATSADAPCAFSKFKEFSEETARNYCAIMGIKPKANQLHMSAAQKAGKKGQTLYSYALWISKAIAQSKHEFLQAGTKAKQLQEEFSAKRAEPSKTSESAESTGETQNTEQTSESASLPTVGEILKQVLLAAQAGLLGADDKEVCAEIARACGFTVLAPVGAAAPVTETVVQVH